MKFKHRLYHKSAKIIRSWNLPHRFSIKPTECETTPFKMVFFSGERDLDYLNSSLVSIYKHWKKLPEIIVISDGTPVNIIEKRLIKWPKKIQVISWQNCAVSLKENGNIYLYNYASEKIIGRKLAGLICCAQKHPILYSDSDVLWFDSLLEKDLATETPQVIMSQDIDFFYTNELIEDLDEDKCLTTQAYNSGVMYLNGDFTSYPKWKLMCEILGSNKDLSFFAEQTVFAILSNYFNPNNFFSSNEILIKIDDEYGLKNTKKAHPQILARHYVSKKATIFWRDFLFMFFEK